MNHKQIYEMNNIQPIKDTLWKLPEEITWCGLMRENDQDVIQSIWSSIESPVFTLRLEVKTILENEKR